MPTSLPPRHQPFDWVAFWIVFSVVCAILLFVWTLPTRAEVAAAAVATPAAQCPSPQPCRILILTQDEERALTGERMILDTAEQGRPLDLGGIVRYFREKIKNAPAGLPAETPK